MAGTEAKRKRGKANRRKGGDRERELVNLLKGRGLPARRGAPLQTQGGAPLPDVVVDGAPFWLEVKGGKRVRIRDAMAQAIREAPAGYTPVVCWREDRQEWLVTARLEDILDVALEVLERVEVIERRPWIQITDADALASLKRTRRPGGGHALDLDHLRGECRTCGGLPEDPAHLDRSALRSLGGVRLFEDTEDGVREIPLGPGNLADTFLPPGQGVPFQEGAAQDAPDQPDAVETWICRKCHRHLVQDAGVIQVASISCVFPDCGGSMRRAIQDGSA